MKKEITRQVMKSGRKGLGDERERRSSEQESEGPERKGAEIRAGEEAMGKSYDKLMEQREKCMREKGEKGTKEMRGKKEKKGRREENNGMMK